jgi:hypothetical protein
MSELLRRIQGEIHERRMASEAAVREYERLQAAVAALDDVAGAAVPRSPARPRNVVGPSPAPKAPRRPVAKRAPRGANREAVLRVVGDRPGVGVNELASATGVTKPVLYALLSRLLDQGEIVKDALPSGSTGYALRRDGVTGSPVEVPANHARSGGAPDVHSV